MILTTGGTGTVGSETVRQLAAAGVPVRALVRDPARATAIAGPGVELARGDLADPTTLDAAFQGIEKAFLMPPNDERQVVMQDNFIAAAGRAGVRQIVKLSVLGADLDSPARYLRWHAQGRKSLEASGIPFTDLQPNSFMQNMLRVAQPIAFQGVFYQPCEDAKISHVDARDIAAVAVRALTEEGHEGKTYVITGPEALSFDQVAEVFSAVLKRPVQYVNVSPADHKQVLLGYGVPEWWADGLNELHAYYREGKGALVTDAVAQVTKKPPITFSQFAQDYAPAFQGSSAAHQHSSG